MANVAGGGGGSSTPVYSAENPYPGNTGNRNTGYLLPGDVGYNAALATGNSASTPGNVVQDLINKYGSLANVPASESGGGGGYYGGGGGYAAPTVLDLTLNTTVPTVTNDLKKPAALSNEATDKEKADYWLSMDKWWQKEAEARLSQYNQAKLELARLEMMYPQYTQSQAQSQAILDARAKVATLEASYKEAVNKADTISVSTSVAETRDGDKVSTTNTYVITDDKGETVSTTYSQENGGMTAAELRTKQEQDRNKALQASDAAVRAAAEQSVNEQQAQAQQDYEKQSALTELENYRRQFEGNLDKINADYRADQLQGNQDLLMASNETARNAVQNSREAQGILNQYNLGGSSLGGRLNQIASEAANQSNQVAALAYNQKMQEADRSYGDARLQLENQRSNQENAYNQAVAQSDADYLSRMANIAGKNMVDMSSYANPDYWYGTMFDAQGNRLNSFEDMNSQAMQDYATAMASKYQGLQQQYGQQQQDYSTQQAQTKANQYVSAYTTPAAKTYETGLKSYTPVNSNTSVLGTTETQPYLEREKEGAL